MSEIPLRFRKKQYEIGTDSQSGVVTFDSEGKRILVEDDVYGASKLEQLTDVEIGTLAGGQVLMYNAIGSKWENTDGIKEFYDCVFTLTPDPNADPETEFPNNTLITCNRTPSEIAAAFGDGKEISASLLMTDSGETEYGPIYGSLNFVAAPQFGTDVVGFIFPFMALGIVDIWIHNTDATQDWSADFSRYTLKVYRDNNDEPTNEILIDRYGGTSSIRIPQTLNGLDGVTISTAENGQVISYNGSQWVNTSLATVATSGSYNDLTGRPTIGSGILTLQKNGTTIGTFGANDASNKTVNITVPTVGTLNTSNSATQPTNSAESLGGTVNLHKVSKTGKYTDLIGAPTVGSGILSVNIGTYTIGTFGANDGSDKTITLPTATDVDIDVLFSGFTVNVTVGTGGGGTVSASSSEVDYGGSVTLTATANTNWAFLKWSDNNTDNPRTISNITENVSLTAIFEQTAFTVRALETRNLAPGDIVNPEFMGTSVPSLSTSKNFPVGTVTEITVQKNGTVYLYDKVYIPSFNDTFGGLSWEYLDSQHSEPAPTQCGLLLAYEYSTDNGATWIPKVIVNGGGIDENSIQVNSDMLVRFVQTGNVYRMRANLNVSGDSDWTGGWQFNGFIGTNPEDYPYGISKTFASTSFDNYPNYNIPYYGDLAVFNGMRLYIMSGFNVSAMGISSGENVCSLSGYYNNGNNSYEYPLYYTTLDGGSLGPGDSAVVVFGTGYFPELGQNVYNATVVEKPSDVEEYYLDSYFNFSSMNEPIDPENPDEPAW